MLSGERASTCHTSIPKLWCTHLKSSLQLTPIQNTSDDQIYNSVWFLSWMIVSSHPIRGMCVCAHTSHVYIDVFLCVFWSIVLGKVEKTKFCKKVLRSRDWSAVSTPRKVKETVSALSTYPDILRPLLWGLLVVVKQLVWFFVRDLEFFYSVAATRNVAFPATFWQNDASCRLFFIPNQLMETCLICICIPPPPFCCGISKVCVKFA